MAAYYIMIGEEKKVLRKRAKELRNNMTRAEIILWSRIRLKQINGYKFRRQYPLLDYIVDFYCHKLKLIIEVDGGIHTLPEQAKSDKYRDNLLKNNGYNVIRLTNHEIETNLEGSLLKIKSVIPDISS